MLDADVVDIQDEEHRRMRRCQRWFVVWEPDGRYSVHSHSPTGVAPAAMYDTAEEAAARLLQLMEIRCGVLPQSWPERVGIDLP